MRRAVVIGLVLALGATSSAHAAEQQDDAERPPPPPVVQLSEALPAPVLRVDLGVGSPVGVMGLVYSRPVASWLGLEAEIGTGFSGVQIGGMAKLRLGGERVWFTPGLGFSMGVPTGGEPMFHEGHPMGDDERRGDAVTMLWMDVDLVGVEYRSDWGLVLGASGGLTFPLTHAHWDVGDMGGDIGPGDAAPQLRVGMGWTF